MTRQLFNHWRPHICVSKLTIIALDNGLSPGRRQAIIWINAGILLIWPLETNFSEILFKIHTFSIKNMLLKMSFGKWRSFCLGLDVLIVCLPYETAGTSEAGYTKMFSYLCSTGIYYKRHCSIPFMLNEIWSLERRKPSVIIIPTLPSLAALRVNITTCGTTGDDKIGT